MPFLIREMAHRFCKTFLKSFGKGQFVENGLLDLWEHKFTACIFTSMVIVWLPYLSPFLTF